MDVDLLKKHPLLVVGSVLSNDNPRDVDMVLVMTDCDFEKRFMSVEEWVEQGKSGKWFRPRYKWSRACIKLSRIIEKRMGTRLGIDLKIIPKSQNHG